MKILSISWAPLVILISIPVIAGVITSRDQASALQYSRSIRENTVVNALEVRSFWNERIDRVGAQSAYAEFKDFYQDRGFAEQHVAAHVMGALLYDKIGYEGVGICDDTFSFGCFHSLFGRAFAGSGLDVVKELDRACVERYGVLGTGCMHGIGHGLMEYLGPEKLSEALDNCLQTTQVNPLFGCTTGVFMEFNLQINIDSDGASTKVRPLTSEDPHDPCPSISNENFRTTCYFGLGQWWNRIFGSDFKKIGQLCEDIDEEKGREACFLGVGNVASPSTEYSITATVKLCQDMPTKYGELTCRSGASWSFLADPKREHLAPEICADLTELERQTCVQKSDLIGEKTKIQ